MASKAYAFIKRRGYVIPEDVQIQKEYFEDIQKNAGIANQQVDFMAIGQKVGFENIWLVLYNCPFNWQNESELPQGNSKSDSTHKHYILVLSSQLLI